MPLDPARRNAALTVFLAVAYALGWFVQVQVAQAAGAGQAAPELLPLLAASAPALAVPLAVATWLARSAVEHQGFGDAGLRLPATRWLAAGWLTAPLLVALTMAASLPLNAPDLGLAQLRATLAAGGAATTPSPAAALGVQGLAMLALYPVFAFGQELGWRGYLLPRLVQALGPRRGVLLHGLAWGAWYAPLIAFGGFGYPGHPALGILLFTLFGGLMGVVLAWLTFASGSILPATLAHGGLMAAGGLAPALLEGVDPAVSGQPWSPVGLGVLALLVAGLWASGALGRALARGPASLQGAPAASAPST
ncbi:MAG: CPBP family intramembrane metalloprotease [Anaeromyxobacter sp.]|nr:CPBP family intramembrane metalloprotease [Anaeromyxobacter sp.]MBL0277281.1 CPBP family intramembrane metalloprotease [Anaeromyxobacter sp.]